MRPEINDHTRGDLVPILDRRLFGSGTRSGAESPYGRRVRGAKPVEPLSTEQRELMESYLPLALSAAKRFLCKGWGPWEVLYDQAIDSLVDAARQWNPDRGHKFSTHVVRRVNYDIIEVFMRPKKRQSPAAKWFSGLSRAPDLRAPDLSFEAREECERLLRQLPSALATTARLVYLEGLTQSEAGRRMGVQQTTVNDHLRLARKLAQGLI